MYNDEFNERKDNCVNELQTVNDSASQSQSENNKRTSSVTRRRSFKKAIAAALCCALAGSAVGAGTVMAFGGTSGTSTTLLSGTHSSTNAVTLSSVNTGKEMTAAEVYATYVNSTVGITTETSTNYFGYETTSAAAGSGFIISSDGYIVTNYHVIEDSDTITVSTYDNKSYSATLVGYDESNDIAVLKIDATDLTPVVMGDSDELNVGDGVLAIGNPLGELTFSLTTGVVSALNRSVTLTSSSSYSSGSTTMNLIQTDCAINSGNSGGALFNMYGEVIGITNAKYSGSSSSGASIDNIGFAIPLNSVKKIITGIIENGTVEKSYIGVSVSAMTTEAAASSGLTNGALIRNVTDSSPASEAGLKEGDIVTKAGDKEITGASDLAAVIAAASSGDKIVLTVNRSGETLEITVTVSSKVSSALPENSEQNSSDSGSSYGSGYGNEYGYGNGYGNEYGNGYGYGYGNGNGNGYGNGYGNGSGKNYGNDFDFGGDSSSSSSESDAGSNVL